MDILEIIRNGESVSPYTDLPFGDKARSISWTGAVKAADGHIIRYLLAPGGTLYQRNAVILIQEEWTSAGSFTWTVPERVEEVTLCMIGGGGGANSGNEPDRTYNGGLGGDQVHEVIITQEGESFSGSVGRGGQSVEDGTGNNGQPSTFSTFTANGGRGGGFNSNGGVRNTCAGDFNNGKMCGPDYQDTYWRGGGAGFATGPNCGQNGTRGSGAGADSYGNYKGGAGVVRITYEPVPYFPGWMIGNKFVLDVYLGNKKADASFFGNKEPGK